MTRLNTSARQLRTLMFRPTRTLVRSIAVVA